MDRSECPENYPVMVIREVPREQHRDDESQPLYVCSSQPTNTTDNQDDQPLVTPVDEESERQNHRAED